MIANHVFFLGYATHLPKGNGGARRDRTDDLKLAKLPLSQLSYGPIFLRHAADAEGMPLAAMPLTRKTVVTPRRLAMGKRLPGIGGPG